MAFRRFPLWWLAPPPLPKGKHVTGFSGRRAPLHPLLSPTHWILRSLPLPYESSSLVQLQFLCHPAKAGHYGCWALCHMILLIGKKVLLPPRAAIHNPQRPKAAIKPENPPARKGRSILRTFLYNPFAQPAAKPRPFVPQGRVLLHSGPRRALCAILPAYHSIQAGYYSLLSVKFYSVGEFFQKQ